MFLSVIGEHLRIYWPIPFHLWWKTGNCYFSLSVHPPPTHTHTHTHTHTYIKLERWGQQTFFSAFTMYCNLLLWIYRQALQVGELWVEDSTVKVGLSRVAGKQYFLISSLLGCHSLRCFLPPDIWSLAEKTPSHFTAFSVCLLWWKLVFSQPLNRPWSQDCFLAPIHLTTDLVHKYIPSHNSTRILSGHCYTLHHPQKKFLQINWGRKSQKLAWWDGGINKKLQSAESYLLTLPLSHKATGLTFKKWRIPLVNAIVLIFVEFYCFIISIGKQWSQQVRWEYHSLDSFRCQNPESSNKLWWRSVS